MAGTIVLAGAARTAIADFGGGFKDVPPTALGAAVAKAAIARAGLEPDAIEHVVYGNVIQTEPRDMYLARVAAIDAGIPDDRPAMTLNRLCGSGAQAIVSAAQMIRLGEVSVALAGGAESMSRAPYSVPAARFGQKMGDVPMFDWLTGVLTDPFGHGHMGVTAENVADLHQVTRERQDAAALESHRRASKARADGVFREQIVPVEIPGRRGPVVVDTDEHPRDDASLEQLGSLRPVFRKGGTVTAGNASGINDGAAAVVLVDEDEAERRGLRPMARLLAWGHAGVPPEIMGVGPVKAVPIALQRAGLTLADIDLIESNEAFAAQSCAVADQLGFPQAQTNPDGGAIALGHPVGATGAILTVKMVYALARTGGRYGIVTMCIGGGQGIALVIERPTDWH